MKKQHASGSFEVKITPLTLHHPNADWKLSRMAIDKTFSGDLVATSSGEMLAAGTAVSGSAGYVAIERVEGKLAGHKGSFVLQHNGTMDREQPSLNVSVVPDSGTEELTGLIGSMSIKITGGKHYYEFDYSLKAAAVK
jgi:Protein of unknown function (DUF3224)